MTVSTSPNRAASAVQGQVSTQKRSYQVCTRCVMDTTNPRIEFDAAGVCNHCHEFDAARASRLVEGAEGERVWRESIAAMKAAGKGHEYDCVVGISGGVDSTYVTYLVAKAGLRPLAVHLDNGWNSELATHNIEGALKRLGVDLHTHVIDWEEFRELQLAFLRASTPDSELPTDHAIFGLLLRTANKHRIPYIVTGMNFATESTNVPDWTYSPADWRYIKGIHRKYAKGTLRTYPHFSLAYLVYTMAIRRVKIVSPLNYIPYDRQVAMETLKNELGWRDYGGKHHESIYTRFFQSYILPRKFDIDKRRAHYSDRIKSGLMTREEALEALRAPPCDPQLMQEDRQYALKKLRLTEAEFEAIMAEPRRTFREFPNNDALIRGMKSLQTWLRKHRAIHK